MDEAREERDELAAIERDDRDEAREQEARREWTDDEGLSWAEHVSAETWRWSR